MENERLLRWKQQAKDLYIKRPTIIRNAEKDYFNNAVTGSNVMVIDAKNCVVNAPNNKLILLQGLENYIVVDTKDVLLICQKEKEQEIKEYVAEVKRNKGEKFL